MWRRATNRLMTVSALVLLIILTSRAHADEVELNRFALDNGVRVLHASLPEAERQSIFIFLPLGLARERAGQAQWSHLLEHMLIFGSGEEIAMDAEMMINGETLSNSMRLEIITVPARFEEAVATVGRWLSNESIDAAALEREKQKIAMEESHVTGNALTHKFAIAAWSQIVHHGAKTAQVHGNVKDAVPARVEKAIITDVSINERMLVATAGPVDAETVKAALAKSIGTLEPREALDTINGAPEPEERTGRWDLPQKHVFVWWQLPEATIENRAALFVLQRAMFMRMMRHGQVLADVRNPMIEIIDAGKDGLLLVSDVNVPEKQDVARGSATPRFVFEKLLDEGEMYGHPAQWTQMIAMELSTDVNFEMIRAQLPEHMKPFAEVNWFLQLAMREFEWNAPIDRISAAIRAVDQEALKKVHAALAEGGSGSLVMTPAPNVPKQ